MNSPVFVECAACAAKPGAPQLCKPCLLRRREIDAGRWAGHGSGRGHGPGGRAEPRHDDTVEIQAGMLWKQYRVQLYDFWRGRFDPARDSGDVTVWRWPHKKDLVNANGRTGVTGPCCDRCDVVELTEDVDAGNIGKYLGRPIQMGSHRVDIPGGYHAVLDPITSLLTIFAEEPDPEVGKARNDLVTLGRIQTTRYRAWQVDPKCPSKKDAREAAEAAVSDRREVLLRLLRQPQEGVNWNTKHLAAVVEAVTYLLERP